MWTPESSGDVRLPKPLERWLLGSRAGSGPTSPPSHSMNAGQMVRTPIVVSSYRARGLRPYSTHLAGICAWREDGTGESILTLSWGMDSEDLSRHGLSLERGDSEEIAFETTMLAAAPSGTSESISPKPPTTGISGVPCDECGGEIPRGSRYVSVVTPPHGMLLMHYGCAARRMNAS